MVSGSIRLRYFHQNSRNSASSQNNYPFSTETAQAPYQRQSIQQLKPYLPKRFNNSFEQQFQKDFFPRTFVIGLLLVGQSILQKPTNIKIKGGSFLYYYLIIGYGCRQVVHGYIIKNMKSYQLLLVVLLVASAVGFTAKNTTKFWETKLNTTLGFQTYAGYQQIDWYHPKGTSGMFYNLFGAAGHNVMEASTDVPLFIWLQGGPGASSQFGAFTEMGPIRIEKGEPKLFDASWNILGHWIFVDSPLNVGFSYYGNREGKEQVSSANQAADHLLNFLYNIYKEFPSLKSSPLYITGESFGGHYVPAFANRLIQNETFRRDTGVKLEGISIGDGWTDPVNQVNFYDSYLWSVACVDRKFRDVLTWFQTNAIINIYDGKYANATSYFDFITNNDTTPKAYFGGISTFNFRNYDDMDESFAKFLETNKAQFGATVKYIPGNDFIYTSFANDVSRSYTSDIVLALRNVKVLIYNGQNDFVVNTPGVLQYLNSLNWEGINQWKRAAKEIWTINGQVRGWAKVSGNLWFVLVNGAGHMVPTDQPKSAFTMMGHFVYGERDWHQ